MKVWVQETCHPNRKVAKRVMGAAGRERGNPQDAAVPMCREERRNVSKASIKPKDL
jgi:hypothetical protein